MGGRLTKTLPVSEVCSRQGQLYILLEISQSINYEILRQWYLFAGDFLQLPPVANDDMCDAGLMAFLHPNFKLIVPHVLKLTQVSESNFIS